MSDRQRHGFVLLLVVGLMAASIFVITTQRTVLGLDLKGGIELVYQGERTPQSPVNQASLNRAVDIMRSRVDQLGVSEPSIQTTGNNLITVGLPDVHDVRRAEREVGQTAQLFFYDWENNVLTPNGKTVASQLLTQDQTALGISQGGATGPGTPGTGGMPLYQAVTLAAKQPPVPGARGPDRPTTSSERRAARPARPSPRPTARRRCRASTASSPARTRVWRTSTRACRPG